MVVAMRIAMPTDILPDFIRMNYEVHEWKHACAILAADFPNEWQDIIEVLTSFRLKKGYIVAKGKNKSLVSAAIDLAFSQRGWREMSFGTTVTIQPKARLRGVILAQDQSGRAESVTDSSTYDSPTHNVDCFKNQVALEIEWNNKDPFFDRDLNNFRLLFDLRVISVGVIITRCDELQTIFNRLGRGKSFGNSTTHMSKLLPRIEGGGGGGCPLLVFGIGKNLYVEDEVVEPDIENLADATADQDQLFDDEA